MPARGGRGPSWQGVQKAAAGGASGEAATAHGLRPESRHLACRPCSGCPLHAPTAAQQALQRHVKMPGSPYCKGHAQAASRKLASRMLTVLMMSIACTDCTTAGTANTLENMPMPRLQQCGRQGQQGLCTGCTQKDPVPKMPTGMQCSAAAAAGSLVTCQHGCHCSLQPCMAVQEGASRKPASQLTKVTISRGCYGSPQPASIAHDTGDHQHGVLRVSMQCTDYCGAACNPTPSQSLEQGQIDHEDTKTMC